VEPTNGGLPKDPDLGSGGGDLEAESRTADRVPPEVPGTSETNRRCS